MTKNSSLAYGLDPIYPFVFNFTIRLNNIGTDSEEILKNIGIEDHLPTEHVTMNKSSEKTIEEYFSQLDRATLDNLYKVYEMDFVLFKYTIDAFYQFVENKTTLHDGWDTAILWI